MSLSQLPSADSVHSSRPNAMVARMTRQNRTSKQLALPAIKAARDISDVSVSFPTANTIQFASQKLFKHPRGSFARTFVERAFGSEEVVQVAIDADKGIGELVLRDSLRKGDSRIAELRRRLSAPLEGAAGDHTLVFPSDYFYSTAASVRLSDTASGFRRGQRNMTCVVACACTTQRCIGVASCVSSLTAN